MCVSIDSMLLDVFALYVGDLRVEGFPIMVSSKPRGGETTRWGSVRESKKIQMYSDRFKSLVECCDDVYACAVCGDRCSGCLLQNVKGTFIGMSRVA